MIFDYKNVLLVVVYRLAVLNSAKILFKQIPNVHCILLYSNNNLMYVRQEL